VAPPAPRRRLAPSPHANSFVIGPAVTNTHTHTSMAKVPLWRGAGHVLHYPPPPPGHSFVIVIIGPAAINNNLLAHAWVRKDPGGLKNKHSASTHTGKGFCVGDYGGGSGQAALLAHAGLAPQGAWPGDLINLTNRHSTHRNSTTRTCSVFAAWPSTRP
jgi:hypothetical protein